MSVEARIDAAMNSHDLNPDVEGDRTAEVDIPSSGLSLEEVESHDLVKDAFEKDDRRFTVYVHAATRTRNFGSV